MTKHLITSFSQLQQFIPTIIGNGDFDMYQTYRDDAETYLVNDIIGSEMFTELLEQHTGSTESAIEWAEALMICRKIVSLKAYHIAIPFLDLVQTSNGFAVMQNTNQAPASKDRVKALRIGVQQRLDDALETLYKYLDDRIDIFIEWTSAPSYTRRYDLLVISATDFTKYVNINNSHRMYLALIPIMQYVEELHIKSSISSPLVAMIKEEILDGDITAPNAFILPDLKNAVANLTLSVAIDRLAVQVDPDGVKLAYVIGESSYSDVSRNKVLADRYEQQGLFYLRKVLQYILNHLSLFAAYTESDIYDDQTAGYQGYANTETDQTFVAGV